LVSATRPNLIDHVVDKNFLLSNTVEITNLKNFAVTSINSLSHATALIIDLTSIKDSDDEIVEAIGKIKNIYEKLKIVVVSDETCHDLLKRIYEKGIYNIIEEVSDEELEFCILQGKNKEDVQKFSTVVPDFKEESLSLSSRFYNFRHPEDNSHMEEEIEIKEKLLPQKDFKKYTDSIFVGVSGTERRIGTTHHALQVTKFLTSIGFKTCYLECTDIEKKIFSIAQMYNNVNKNISKNYIQYRGCDLYSHFKMSEVTKDKYDFYICDIGVLHESKVASFILNQVQIVVGGAKPWEYENVVNCLDMLGGNDSINFLLNYSINADRSWLQMLLSKTQGKIFFTESETDPFDYGLNTEVYKEIFKNYIFVQKIETETMQAENNKGLLKFLKGRRK